LLGNGVEAYDMEEFDHDINELMNLYREKDVEILTYGTYLKNRI